MYQKDFDRWNEIKKTIDNDQRKVFIRACEIRWAILGANVGSEMDGKGRSFTRPVFVVHVIGKKLALVIPLSTKMKDSPGYFDFEWKGRKNSLCIHQVKVLSQKRILKRLGKVSKNKLLVVKKEIIKFYNFDEKIQTKT